MSGFVCEDCGSTRNVTTKKVFHWIRTLCKDCRWKRLHAFSPVLARPTRSLRMALKYIIPKRLTIESNPDIRAWLWWNYLKRP